MPAGVRFRGDDRAALAANWRTLLLVDAALALAAVVIGAAVVARGAVWGWLLVGAGVVYGFFVGGRAARWKRLRRDAGL